MVRSVYTEKKEAFSQQDKLAQEIRSTLAQGLIRIRLIHRYDIENVTERTDLQACITHVFSDIKTDHIYGTMPDYNGFALAVRLLPGQYDQRSDSAAACIKVVTGIENVVVETVRIYIFEGEISDHEKQSIRRFLINPVECMEVGLDTPEKIGFIIEMPEDIPVIENFINMNQESIFDLHSKMGLAMRREDLIHCRSYFKRENRNPTLTEINVIDTYWSDHCRHTTFTTEINEIILEKGKYTKLYQQAFALYEKERDRRKPITLMDMATAAMKSLKKRGLLQDLDESDEINACSIFIDVDVDGNNEEWILQFKNETHNHPTEIEPYGGAATCLGGAIRDPLAGRAYVYQAMRVTGSGNPAELPAETLPGKLPQKTITRTAAKGYSDYGNQMGIATGHGAEIYHEGYKAKRMELGAVIGAVKKDHVCRETPVSGDVVLLVGGRTGRDGCGGATGSSVKHTEDSLAQGGAEVQKGNPLIERNLLRLFRKPEASRLIKKCNDFGAGGISVAVGELADGLDINLDAVPVKYEGLNGTELAISESQERMAVVVSAENAVVFIAMAAEENLECTPVAAVTDNGRMVMRWRGKVIVDIARSFLDSSGAKRSVGVKINPNQVSPLSMSDFSPEDWTDRWLSHLRKLNNACQKGLSEHFDATVGAGTVLMPFGGKHRLTPSQVMSAKIPALGETNTASLMSFGFDPAISEQSPFHGAVLAMVESVAKIVAVGGRYPQARLTFQEYFESLGSNPSRWQKPFLAMLGAFWAQMALELPAIGGKDSMSGSFKDKHVPPTLVSFCVQTAKTPDIISQELKKAGHTLVWLRAAYDENDLPDVDYLKKSFERLTDRIKIGHVKAAYALGSDGLAVALTKMALGNGIGAEVAGDRWFSAETGSFLLEVNSDPARLFDGLQYEIIGKTIEEEVLYINGERITLNDCHDAWLSTLEPIFNTGRFEKYETLDEIPLHTIKQKNKPGGRVPQPRICIPIFPGTNGEYEITRAFENAGGLTMSHVIQNATADKINESAKTIAKQIRQSQILMLAGGFSAGDEPDGGGKYIAAYLKHLHIKDAVQELLRRGGLILGIGNGFQGLVCAGLLDGFTLIKNEIGRHVSDLVMTKIISNRSPWLWNKNPGDVLLQPVSHGQGRLVIDETTMKQMIENGQIAAQYVDFDGKPSMDVRFNPSGSMYAVEGVTNADGRIFGKMGHSERVGNGLYKGFEGDMDAGIFMAGVGYFK